MNRISVLSYSNHLDSLTSDAFADVSSAASDLQRLSLRDSKLELLSTGNGSTLVLPDHVPDLTAKCSHLSFGIYNRGNNSTSSAMLASHLSSGLEEKAAAVDGGSLAQYMEARHFLLQNQFLIYSALPFELIFFLPHFLLQHFCIPW